MSLNIIVLAAGEGKRMQSRLPKVLHPLAGRSLLSHVIHTARELQPQQLIVVIGHAGEAVRAAFTADTAITWVEQTERLGTGHAVQQALPHVDAHARVLVLYGDVPLMRADTLRALVAASDTGLAILTARSEDAGNYGRIVRNQQGAVQRIIEARDATTEERAIQEWNTGVLCAPAVRLAQWLSRVTRHNAQGEYYLTDVIALAVAEGVPVSTVHPTRVADVEGVNSKRELAMLEAVYRRDQADGLLAAGVTLADPARIDVRGQLQCARDVEIDVNCVFEEHVTLGEGVHIGPNCVLRNVSIAAGTQVLAYSMLDGAQVGANCRIGPYARLRPGAQLEADVHIGNFVEVKASHIGAGSKANHLAYVGDSSVGQRVNIGAGTITCNYDGVNKHRTIIEDDCFIGSDATLVAPVTIARGSYVGAGSTISKDTPPGQLTVARAKQISLPSWKPPAKKTKG